MDEYYKEVELQAFDKYLNKNHILKRTLQLVVSVSIFSLILCSSSAGFSFFPHSFNVYFSTFLFSFFTHTLERKYMFLICNGILVFLAKSSVSSSTSSSSASAYYVAGAGDELSDSELPEMKANIVVSPEEVALIAEEVKDTEVLMPENEDEDQDEDEESVIAEAVNEPSTDELNKKIEEFIRKMKEEIRIEAQQQLIAV